MLQRFFAVGLAVAVSLAAPPLSAQGGAEPSASAAGAVEITVIGSEEALARIRDATAAGDLRGAEARWKRAERFDRAALLGRGSGDPGVNVRAFVVLSESRAELYFADRSAERFLVREVPLPNGLDALGSDAVSQVLTLSVVALAENAEAGLTRSQAEELLAPKAPAPEPVVTQRARAASVAVEPEREPSAIGVTPFYALRRFGGGAPLEHGPGLRVAWSAAWERVEAELRASAQYELPLEHRTAAAGVDLETVVLRLGSGVTLAPDSASPWRFGAALAWGLDVVSFTPRPGTAPAELELVPPGRNLVHLLSCGVSAGFRLGSRVTASAELFVDVYPKRVNYTLSVNSAAEDVLVPDFVRPGLALALTLR